MDASLRQDVPESPSSIKHIAESERECERESQGLGVSGGPGMGGGEMVAAHREQLSSLSLSSSCGQLERKCVCESD